MMIDNAQYGITANGIDDDGPALRLALADVAASGAAFAELGPGRYLVGRDGGQTHCLSLPVSVRGCGRGITTIAFPGVSPNAKGVVIYADSITLANLTLDGQWAGEEAEKHNRHNVFVGKYARGARLYDLESINAGGDGVYIHDSSDTVVAGIERRLVCKDNRRNSITLGSDIDGLEVRHALLTDCRTQHIDSEPKVEGRTADHVHLSDIVFGPCNGSSIATPGPSPRDYNKDWTIDRCRFGTGAGNVQVRWVDGLVMTRCYGGEAYLRRGSRNVRLSGNTFQSSGTGVLIRGNTKTGYDVAESVTLSGNTYEISGGTAIECGSIRSFVAVGEQIDDSAAVALGLQTRGLAVYPRVDISDLVMRGCVVRATTAVQLGWPGFNGRVLHASIDGNVLRGAVAVRAQNFGGGYVQSGTL